MAATDNINVQLMNPGDGKTSYAKNSAYQKSGASKSLPVLEDALESMMVDPNLGSQNCYKLVDFGCSSGPNSLWAMTHVVNKIENICKEKNMDYVPEFEVYLNDLPDNDFNSLFKLIPDLFQYGKGGNRVVYGLPCSFYKRLFGKKTLHFAYSSYSIHWLSQVPKGLYSDNKENIYVARESSLKVCEAYAEQFESDFSTFLRLRGEEMVQGGRMVLLVVGRSVESPYDDCASLTLLANSLFDMVKEGLVKREDLYSFNLPLYQPSKTEMVTVIEDKSSFTLDKIQEYRVPWVPNDIDDHEASLVGNNNKSAKLVAHGIRCIMEPMIAKQFGSGIVDALFERYEKKVEAYMLDNKSTLFNILFSLTRK